MFATIGIAVLLILSISAFVARRRIKIPEPRQDGYGRNNDRDIDAAKGGKLITLVFGSVTLAGALIWLLLSTVFPQTVGEARVIVNADGTIAGEKLDEGWGLKAPWQSTVDFDLFAQPVTYAGNKEDGAPSYTGGEVNGYEITTQVAGGAQVNFDLTLTYNQSADAITELYRQFRSQERFTQNVVNNEILAIAREVPAAYAPIDFRGEKRGEATNRITEELNRVLKEYGIVVSVVNIQNIRYGTEVEDSIKAVEVAKQREQEAEANLRATEVSAQAQVVEAQAEADANRLRSSSITPELIEANRVEALREAAKQGSLIVVPDGSSPLIQVPQPAQ